MQAKEIVKLVEKLAVPILEKKGLEFVDVEGRCFLVLEIIY